MDPWWGGEMPDPEEENYWYYYYLRRRRMIEEDMAYRELIERERAQEERMYDSYYRTLRDLPPLEEEEHPHDTIRPAVDDTVQPGVDFQYRDIREHPDDTIPHTVADAKRPRVDFPYRDIREHPDDTIPHRVADAKRPRVDFPYRDIREHPDDTIPHRVADAKRTRVDFPYRDIREHPDDTIPPEVTDTKRPWVDFPYRDIREHPDEDVETFRTGKEKTAAEGGEWDQQWKDDDWKKHQHEQIAWKEEGWDSYQLNLVTEIDTVVEEAGIENMSSEEKQPLCALFKLKRLTTIPWCYTGPQFDGRNHEFMVQVFPVSYRDVWRPTFTAITANASSVRLNFGTRSCMTLMAHAKTVRNLMRDICSHSFVSGDFFVKVEHHKGAESPVNEAGEAVFFPTVMNRATFKMMNKFIRSYLQKAKKEDKSPDEQLRPLSLHNLPQSVGWQFLQVLFPLARRGQVLEGNPNSAVVVLDSWETVAVCVAAMSGLHINGQPVSMKTDMPQHKAVEMLKTVQEATKQEAPGALRPPQKKVKKSPSDIRRSIRKKQEYIARVSRNSSLPEATRFPGVPSLLSLSFPGPGNSASHTPAAGAEADKSAPLPEAPPFPGVPRLLSMSFPGPGNTAQYPAADDPEEDFSQIPIPQLLEGPYPEYEKPLPKGTPGTSTKVRTGGYFRRQKARYAVHMYHLWGGNLKKVAEQMLRLKLPEDQRPPLVHPPDSLLSVAPLTDMQLRQLKNKIKDKVSLEEVKKAEDYWLRKRKEKIEEAYSSSFEKQRTPSKVLRDKQRMTKFNKEKSEQSANTTPGSGHTAAGAAPANIHMSRGSAGPSSHSEHLTKQQKPTTSTAAIVQQQQKQQQSYQYPHAANTTQHQPPFHPSQHSDNKPYQSSSAQHGGNKSYKYPSAQRSDHKPYQQSSSQHSGNKAHQQSSTLMPPPLPPTVLRPKQGAKHAQYPLPPPPLSPTDGGNPAQRPFSYPPPPARPPPARSPSLSSHGRYPYTGPVVAQSPQFSQPPPALHPPPFPPASQKGNTDSVPHSSEAQWQQQQQTGSWHSWPDTHPLHNQQWNVSTGDS